MSNSVKTILHLLRLFLCHAPCSYLAYLVSRADRSGQLCRLRARPPITTKSVPCAIRVNASKYTAYDGEKRALSLCAIANSLSQVMQMILAAQSQGHGIRFRSPLLIDVNTGNQLR